MSIRNKFDFTKVKSKQKPSIQTILLESIEEITSRDKYSDNSDVNLVREENATFYYRVIHLFLSKVSVFYSIDEVNEWMDNNLEENKVLIKKGDE